MYRKKTIVKKEKKETKETKINDSLQWFTEEYKKNVCSQSYLGKKGYTIPKSILCKEDLEFLHKELFVKPIIMGAKYTANEDSNAFPVYRENANKFYIPRFYGISRYGMPTKTEIQLGDDIQVEFAKSLRDYQVEIVDTYINYVTKNKDERSGSVNISDEGISERGGGGGILEVYCGGGKTIIANKIISVLKKKTLIVVHKEFLMNQWIERINEFLPGARIGKIQGQIFDIKNKDIVIGMIQTMYDKEYPADTFSSFGLTIIDEVHRIGSEQFSRTLFKAITPYMLGISATVDRKDQLTKVLYMFIGEKIYSKKRDADDVVSVRAIEYISDDTEFNQVETDFRGNPKYSTMIVKLCEFGPRSDFIVRIIHDLIQEESENQIMVLCHNRSLLTYLYNAIQYRKIASVGYYVGGMKKQNLQETESKQIVLATYAMAAEALDIKSLNTLVMVTPKTDITQSVGRILREKHENPIIVDIIDKHDIFQNQWFQRRRFYKKCNYRIRQITNKDYKNMCIDWETDQTWKRVYEPSNSSTKGLESCLTTEDVEEETEIIQRKCLINIDELGLDQTS